MNLKELTVKKLKNQQILESLIEGIEKDKYEYEEVLDLCKELIENEDITAVLITKELKDLFLCFKVKYPQIVEDVKVNYGLQQYD